MASVRFLVARSSPMSWASAMAERLPSGYGKTMTNWVGLGRRKQEEAPEKKRESAIV